MINDIQRFLYKLSCAAPMIIIVGISLYMQNTSSKICVLIVILSVIMAMYVFVFIWLCTKKLPTITVTVESIASNDMVSLAYIVTYLIPLVGVTWIDNMVLWIIISLVATFFYLKCI